MRTSAPLVTIDHDPSVLACAPAGTVLLADVGALVDALSDHLGRVPPPAVASRRTERRLALVARHRRETTAGPTRPGRPLSPSELATRVGETAAAVGAPVTVDVGLNTLWVYRGANLPRDFVWTASFASMGFALPAALAIATAETRPVVACCGDGGFLMTAAAPWPHAVRPSSPSSSTTAVWPPSTSRWLARDGRRPALR